MNCDKYYKRQTGWKEITSHKMQSKLSYILPRNPRRSQRQDQATWRKLMKAWQFSYTSTHRHNELTHMNIWMRQRIHLSHCWTIIASRSYFCWLSCTAESHNMHIFKTAKTHQTSESECQSTKVKGQSDRIRVETGSKISRSRSVVTPQVQLHTCMDDLISTGVDIFTTLQSS